MTTTDYSQAACVDTDPELFFPVGTGDAAVEQTAEALSVCAGCPVRTACLTEALEAHDVHGVRGGMTGDQRAAVLPRRQRGLPLAAMARSSKRAQRARELHALSVGVSEIAARLGLHRNTVRDYLAQSRRERGAA